MSTDKTLKILRANALTLPASQFFSVRFILEAMGKSCKPLSASKIANNVYDFCVSENPEITVLQLLAKLKAENNFEFFLDTRIGGKRTRARLDFQNFCLKFGVGDFWEVDPKKMNERDFPLSSEAQALLKQFKEV